ncbi:MAG: Rpn family recombination-promoting nuclease/putative transposase [Leptolinea sp.]
MAEHDQSYKQFFSNPRMVEDLLRGYVKQDWIKRVDFSTLERVPASFVSDDLKQRVEDMIWRVRLDDGWLYIYILLEFQFTVDRFMVVRMLTYIGLLYQDLIKRRQVKEGEFLPPVLPLVLYNGRTPWKAPLDLEKLVAPAPGKLKEAGESALSTDR